ncbi:MAG: hypothetical protein FJ267_12345, partial [Planctomycetes bacterium]|nr:hypothetical protein [Planctomycetota bacterium]
MIDWVDAVQDHPHHEVVLVVTLLKERERLRGRSGFRLTDQWEDLLVDRDIDAVLVGGNEPDVLDAIKQLASAGRPLLFVPDAAQGSTFQYELGLIRDDNQVWLSPALVDRFDPVIAQVRHQLMEHRLGPARLLQWERSFTSQGKGEPLEQRTIDESLLHDLDLSRWLGGDYDQVTAIRTAATNGTVMTQTVTIAGRGIPEATWHAQATDGSEVCRLTIHCERGNLILERIGHSGEWSLTELDGKTITGNRLTAIRSFLDQVATAWQTKTQLIDWLECVRDFEMLDATQRSVNRRRTIDLHFEPMSERAIFKSQMTAMGCGVLVLTFLLVLVYLAIGSTIPLPGSVLMVLR